MAWLGKLSNGEKEKEEWILRAISKEACHRMVPTEWETNLNKTCLLKTNRKEKTGLLQSYMFGPRTFKIYTRILTKNPKLDE